MSAFNVIDIMIIVIFLLSVIIGFGRGLVSEVISLLTTIAAFVIAVLFANPLATYFTTSAAVQNVVNETSSAIGASTAQPVSYMALGVSFAALFAATVMVGSLFKMILNMFFQVGILGVSNRILGGLFGLVRGAIIVLVIIFVVQLSPISKEPWWQQSKYVPEFQPGVVWMADHVSPALSGIKDTFGSTIDDMSTSIKGAAKSVTDTISKDKP